MEKNKHLIFYNIWPIFGFHCIKATMGIGGKKNEIYKLYYFCQKQIAESFRPKSSLIYFIPNK